MELVISTAVKYPTCQGKALVCARQDDSGGGDIGGGALSYDVRSAAQRRVRRVRSNDATARRKSAGHPRRQGRGACVAEHSCIVQAESSARAHSRR